MKIVCNMLLYIVFQYGLEPVLIQQIYIGFQAIGEILFKDQINQLYLFRGQSGHFLVLLFDKFGEGGQRIIIQGYA